MSGGGTLYVVATPIGNLGDVTLRALEVLRSVTLVAAEDTRLTRRLFARHAISTPLTSLHARNARARLPELLARLREGTDLAMVTDAGTPSVSDPGEELVAAWSAEGGRVVPIPGPSALLAAISATGIAGPRWSFEGFLPRSGRERRERIERLAADPRGAVVFEAPGRLAATLDDLAAACGGDRPAAVCRELTKIHESIVRGALASLAAAAHDGTIPARGEMTIVLGASDSAEGLGTFGRGSGAPGAGSGSDRLGGPRAVSEAAEAQGRGGEAAEAEARRRVHELVAGGMASGDAARRVSAETGIGRRRLYPSPRSEG